LIFGEAVRRFWVEGCRREMERHVDPVAGCRRCLAVAADQATSEARQAIERITGRARGGGFCP
jgi:hypothetical protein